MPTGKSKLYLHPTVHIHTGILKLRLQWLETRTLNKLAYLPKDPRVVTCTDGNATKLPSLTLGKKLVSESLSSNAPVCMQLSLTK